MLENARVKGTVLYVFHNLPPSLTSVDGKQHLNEVMFSALVGFSLPVKRRNYLFPGRTVHPGLVTSDYGFHEVGPLFVEFSMSCVYLYFIITPSPNTANG